MSKKKLVWDSNRGLLSLVSPAPDTSLAQHKSRPGSQTYELIKALFDGPLPKERLIRRVLAMKGIEDADIQKQLESQLRTLVSRINKDLGEKVISIQLGAYSFDSETYTFEICSSV